MNQMPNWKLMARGCCLPFLLSFELVEDCWPICCQPVDLIGRLSLSFLSLGFIAEKGNIRE